jgi:hypothetical protein
MHLSFANPAGFWALAAWPAILLIHFLQRESRRVVTSAFFLFEQLAPVSAQGRRFERLRSSLPLWLQLAAVALIAWLLAQPRWLRHDSTLTVAVVLDSSVSMRAFREPMRHALEKRLRALAHAAARTQWALIESDPARPTLYAGSDLGALLATLSHWQPHLGTHDFAPALRTAQGLVRGGGITLFVSDRITELPEGVELLAVGRPIDNCGWIGLSVEDEQWHALLKNYTSSSQTRTWHAETNGAPGPSSQVTLAPGEALTLSGALPPSGVNCELVLDADAFPLDDRLPILRPVPKRLGLKAEPTAALGEFFQRFAASIPNADLNPGTPDVRLAIFSPADDAGCAIRFVTQEAQAADYAGGEVIAENQPLTAELNWNGLLCKDTLPAAPRDGDQPLLWQGQRPLLFLRGAGANRSLIVNFDLRQSNADRLPAFIVLLNRFVESVRAAKVAPEQANVETNELLSIASDPGGPPLVSSTGESALRAPAEPGFFRVTQRGVPLLTAAAHFGDPRQADFRAAASVDTLEGKTAKITERNSEEDFLAPVWVLSLVVLCLANWAATAGTTPRRTRAGLPVPAA